MNELDIKKLIKNDLNMMQILAAVRDLKLPDSWIGAGFIRSKIWDHLHGYDRPTNLPDVDVIYYDKNNLDESIESKLQDYLKSIINTNWSVTNQARMHIYNNDDEYSSSEDAIAHWPETVTAIAVRINDDNNLEIIAPYGIGDLVNLVVRMSPKFKRDKSIYINRVNGKKWSEKWPKLKILHP